jgi:hypothetical protein
VRVADCVRATLLPQGDKGRRTRFNIDGRQNNNASRCIMHRPAFELAERRTLGSDGRGDLVEPDDTRELAHLFLLVVTQLEQ